MARRALQLVAALALVGGVLGVSTALIDQARDEVLSAEPPQRDPQFSQPDDQARGLPLHAFTLLDPAPAHLPNRTGHDRQLQLDGNGTLSLEDGDRIQPAPLPVPSGARLSFPEGGQATTDGYACPDGCLLETGGQRLTVPAGGEVHLESAAPGREDPSPDEEVVLAGPARVKVDPIEASGPTPIPLHEGAIVRLPQGHEVPAPDQEAFRLPADTRVRGPPGDEQRAPRLDDVQDGPEDAPGSSALQAPPPANVTITEHPRVLRKGVTFDVAGTVEGPNGTPLVNQPVQVLANASLDRPGFEVQLGTVHTDAAGRFNATARVPVDRPARDYHLVARATPGPDADPLTRAGFDDVQVPIAVQPRLSLDAPEREGARIPVSVQVALEDVHGAPVPDRVVEVQAPGTGWTGTAATGDDGTATLVHPAGFPHPGNWSLAASYPGTEHAGTASAEATVEVLDTRIDTAPTLVVPRGGEATLAGQVHHAGDTSNVTVRASLGEATANATTDDEGAFTLDVHAPRSLPLGNRSLVLETDGVTARRTVVATVVGQVALDAEPPPALPRGGRIDLPVVAVTDAGEPASGLAVEVRAGDRASRTVVTDDEGRATARVPLEGDRVDVTLSTTGTEHLAPATHNLTIHPSPLAVQGELTAGLATPRTSTVTLTAGAPLADEPLRLHGGTLSASATTDGDGRARFELAAGEDAAPGRHRAYLVAPGHELVQPVDVTVLDQPTLEVAALEGGAEGEPVRVEARLTGAQGPLSDVPVTARAEGAFTAQQTALTGPDGTATLVLDRPGDADGPVEVTLEAPRTGETASAQAATETTVTSSPFPWWIALIAAPALIGAGAWAYKRRQPEAAPAAEDDPRLGFRLRRQRPGWPAVWHPGDPVDLAVTLEDADGHPAADEPITLEGPAGSRTLRTDEEGVARVRLPAHDAGTHRYTARVAPEADAPPAEATLELRVTDYAEEVDREYRRLRETAVRQGLARPDATPHELAHALGDTPAARRVAEAFERASYSTRSVAREDYERFMKAKEACGPDGA